MALNTINPTNHQSPDATLGGSAVTTPSNTGHAQTTASIADPSTGTSTKTCRWFGFQSIPPLLRRTLKVTYSSDGTLLGASTSNQFSLQYSLNAGANWADIAARINFSTPQGPATFELALDPAQDTSQVQIRDLISATVNVSGDAASATATVSDIKIELLSGDMIVMM